MLIKTTHRWRYPEMALQTLMQIQQQEILTIQSKLENVNSMKDKYFKNFVVGYGEKKSVIEIWEEVTKPLNSGS